MHTRPDVAARLYPGRRSPFAGSTGPQAGATGPLDPPSLVAEPLRVPPEALVGLGGEFAALYSRYLEAPPAFLFFAFLTYFGAIVARKIVLDSALDPPPRLYTVLLGESADTRKSTALRKTDEFFKELGLAGRIPVLFGVGSAEGIAAQFGDGPDLLLHYDEGPKAFVDKARNEHSNALAVVSTLFERGDYDNRTKDSKVSVRDARLSLLGACTLDTYATLFDRNFHSIGILNRFWLVVDRSDARIAVPRPSRWPSGIRSAVPWLTSLRRSTGPTRATGSPQCGIA